MRVPDHEEVNGLAQEIARILLLLRGASSQAATLGGDADKTLNHILSELQTIRSLVSGGRVEPRLFTVDQAATYIGRTRKGVEQ
jgi:hypothetical protein